MDEIQQRRHIREDHSRDVQMVDLKLGVFLHAQRDQSQSHRCTEVKDGGDEVVHEVGGGPAALVVVPSAGEHQHPDEGQDETEN